MDKLLHHFGIIVVAVFMHICTYAHIKFFAYFIFFLLDLIIVFCPPFTAHEEDVGHVEHPCTIICCRLAASFGGAFFVLLIGIFVTVIVLRRRYCWTQSAIQIQEKASKMHPLQNISSENISLPIPIYSSVANWNALIGDQSHLYKTTITDTPNTPDTSDV